jgi:hypothetical protein
MTKTDLADKINQPVILKDSGTKKKGLQKACNPLSYPGAGGRGRTGMPSRALDFESSASTNFTTPAKCSGIITKACRPVKQEIPPNGEK